MKVKALISFSGVVSMTQGQAMNIEEGEVLTDLLQCGYVEEVEQKRPYIETKQEPETGKEPGGEKVPEEGQDPEGEMVPEETKEPEGEKVPEEGQDPEGEMVPEETKEPEGEKAPEETKEPEGEKVAEEPKKKSKRGKSKAVSADEGK